MGKGPKMQNFIRDAGELTGTHLSMDLSKAEMSTILSFLHDLERKQCCVRFLEIGVFGGGNINFLKAKTSKVIFTGIDLFEDFKCSSNNTHVSGTYLLESVQRSLGNDVRLIKGASENILPRMSELFDFIFIDGNHAYAATKEDFFNSIRLLAPCGYIGFHNCSCWGEPDIEYNRIDGGPWKLTQEIKRMPEWHLEAEVDRVRVFAKSNLL